MFTLYTPIKGAEDGIYHCKIPDSMDVTQTFCKIQIYNHVTSALEEIPVYCCTAAGRMRTVSKIFTHDNHAASSKVSFKGDPYARQPARTVGVCAHIVQSIVSQLRWQ